MPRIILPNGQTEYYESEEELNEAKARAQAEAPQPTPAAKPAPKQAPQAAAPQPVEQKEEAPSWWEETLRTLGFMGVQVPSETTKSFQATAQSTPAAMIAGMAGGDPTAYLLAQSIATKKPFKQVYKEDVAQAEKGRRAAQVDMSIPDEQGSVYKLGIPKDIPVLGELSDEGSVYKAFEPKTEIGKTIADVGSAVVMSAFLPDITPTKKLQAISPLKNLLAGKGSLRAAFKADPIKYIQRSIGSAYEIAKRVAVDLPQDFIEELFIFGIPEPTEDEVRLRDELINTQNPEMRQAIARRILTDDEAEAAYYDRYFGNVIQNTALAGVFRGSLGSLNNTLKLYRAKGRLKAKDIAEAAKKPVEDSIVHFERDAFEVVRRQEMEELANLNNGFTSLYRDSVEPLSQRARGLQAVEQAMVEPAAQMETFGGAAETALAAQTEVQTKIDFLNNQIKARSESIKEMDQMEAKNPGYLKGKNKTRYNRYLRQIEDYQSQFDEATKEFQEKAGITTSLQDRVSLASAQASSLEANKRMTMDGFISEIDPLMTRLQEMVTRRQELAPDMDLSQDPYFQSYDRVRVAFENYKLFGGPETYQGAPGLEEKRLRLQNDLLDTIQAEFEDLQQFGGAAPVEIKPEVIEAAAKAAQGEAPTAEAPKAPKAAPEAPEGAKKAPKAPAAEPAKAPDMEQKRLWEDPTITPLKTNDEGRVVVDPDANAPSGVTPEVPQNKVDRIRQAQINLGLRDADAPEQITEQVRRASTDDSVRAYLAELNEIEALEARMEGKGVVPYNRDSSAIKALERSVGKYDTYEAGKMAIIDALRRLQNEPEDYIGPVLKRGFREAGKLAKAYDEFQELYDLLAARRKGRAKAMKGVTNAMFEMVATPLAINIHGSRLYRVTEALYGQMDQLSDVEKGSYRAIAAQEGLMLYQAVGDFMKLRRMSSNLLSIQQARYGQQMASAFTEARMRVQKGKDPEKAIEKFVKDVESYQAQLAQDAMDKLPSYIGLPSNLRNIEEILNKFTDPNLKPDENDLNVFNKIIAQLNVAGLNAEALGSLSINGDRILGTQIQAGGLSAFATQASFLPQTAIYGGVNWVNKLASGKINQLWNTIPWLVDKEALKAAQTEAKIATLMPRMMAEVSGNVLQWAYKGRQFNRSIITDALAPLDDTSKFAGPRFKDPIREAEQLKILNNPNGVSENSIFGHLKKYIPEERLLKYRNNFALDMVNLHDLFFMGDALEQMGTTGAGKFGQFMYKYASPQGLTDRAIGGVTRGAVTPFQSKLPSGERIGGTLPLVASETSTELIGGLFANAMAKAKAYMDIEAMVDSGGKPKFAVGSKLFNDAVNKRYMEEYLAPINVGIGEKAETIAYAVKDKDAQLLAMAMDMMMPLEDDVWGGITKASQKLADSDYTLLKAVIAPYVKTPLNAHKFHFYYSQPLPMFSEIPGMQGLPMGVGLESAVGIKRLIQQFQGHEELADRITGFQSKIFHKDARVRAEARSALVMSTLLNTGVFALVESNALEITGGQNTSYREALDASIPAYSVKINGHWVPYRFLPFVGELLAYHANLRDYKRRQSAYGAQEVLGGAIVATAQTFLDTPAIAGIDTMIAALREPAKAEDFILDYFERIGGVRYPALRKAVLREFSEAYAARPVTSGQRAGILKTDRPKYQDLSAGEAERFTIEEGLRTLPVAGLLEFPIRMLVNKANNLGLLPLIEAMDQMKGNEVMKGDYRQAHWYKPGDITYFNPSERSTMQTFLGRHWPVPADSDPVDVELFRHGIEPPTQVFRRFGIVANEVMVNRFRRFLGTEYRGADGKTLEDIFRDTVENKVPIPGLVNVYYKDLPDDERNSLVINPGAAPVFDTDEVVTKRSALMQIRSDHINRAVIEFLTGETELIEGANVVKKPIQYSAPADAKREYQNWKLSKFGG